MLGEKLVQSQRGIRLDVGQELPGMVGFLLAAEDKQCGNSSIHEGPVMQLVAAAASRQTHVVIVVASYVRSCVMSQLSVKSPDDPRDRTCGCID